MSSSLFSSFAPGTSGKSDGTLGKLDKSSMCGGGAVADGGVGGVIFDLGCGFGALFKFYCQQKKAGEETSKWNFKYCCKNLYMALKAFLLHMGNLHNTLTVLAMENRKKSTWSTGRLPEIIE